MTEQQLPDDERPPTLAEDSPTELVETDDGELVERLSGSTLLAAWIFAAVILKQHLGIGALFSGFGLYVGLFGAAGPTVLWLTGRAQDHSLGWFVLTALKIGLLMIGLVIAVTVVAVLILGGGIGPGALIVGLLLVGVTLLLAVLWALATWSADRYIARARTEGE